MKTEILRSALEGVGLSKKESTVYLAALECGTASASTIADKAKMNRITAYGILLKLQEKEYVEPIEKGGVKNFIPISPLAFKEKAEKNLENLGEVTPLLSKLMGRSDIRPRVKFLEGLEGIKKGYKKTLSSKTEILSIANSQNIREIWPEYDNDYVAKRARKNICLRGVTPKDSFGEIVQTGDEKYNRQTRLLDTDLMPSDSIENEICIFDDSVLIVSFQPDIFAVLIQSPTVAQTQRQIFEILWKVAGK